MSGLAIGVALACWLVAAQVAAGPVPFSAFDADGDGAISEQEFDEVRSKRGGRGPSFGDFDADGDGKLSPAELSAGRAARRQQRQAVGADRPQSPGKGMAPGRRRPAFEDFDVDGDGAISEKELHEARAKRMSERAAEGRQLKKAARAPSFADLDADGDGKLSREEFAAHQARRKPPGPPQ